MELAAEEALVLNMREGYRRDVGSHAQITPTYVPIAPSIAHSQKRQRSLLRAKAFDYFRHGAKFEMEELSVVAQSIRFEGFVDGGF